MAWWSAKKAPSPTIDVVAERTKSGAKRPVSEEFKAWLDAGKPGDFKEFERRLHAQRAKDNPMGLRFYRLRDELGEKVAVIDTAERQGPCRTAMANLHGRKLASRASNARTRFTIRLNEATGRVDVKDDRYVIGYLAPDSADTFVGLIGLEKAWLYGVLRYTPGSRPEFTADIDWTRDHEGNLLC